MKKYEIQITCSNHIQDGNLDYPETFEFTDKEIEDYNNGVKGNRVDKVARKYHSDVLETGWVVSPVEE